MRGSVWSLRSTRSGQKLEVQGWRKGAGSKIAVGPPIPIYIASDRIPSQHVGVGLAQARPNRYQTKSLASLFKSFENAKKREYVERVTEVEHGSFTPLVFSSCGGAGAEATVAIKRIASLLAAKRRESYSKIISWMRCSLAFSLARSAIRCLRGSRSIRRRAREFAPVDLVSTEASIRPL